MLGEEVKRMDAPVAYWVVGSFGVTLISLGACWRLVRYPHTFVAFFMSGASAYIALAYWLGRSGGCWALTGGLAVVLILPTGCVWLIRSTREEPSSFDGYPILACVLMGVGAAVALMQGLEALPE
jgi:hypothetical protein